MPEPEWVEIGDRCIEFDLWPAGTDYETYAPLVEDIKIRKCLDALMAHSEQMPNVVENSEPIRIDLWVELDKNHLFAWEKNALGIAINHDEQGKFRAEFTLNTAIGMQSEVIRNSILPAVETSGFKLGDIKPLDNEWPILDADGYHGWTCWVTDFPEDASFADLFVLRHNLSQTVFLLQDIISTPYLALKMVQLGQAQALLGLNESEWLEVKSFPYELKNIAEDSWKHELAQDVVQFANTQIGGLLAIGFRTKRKAGLDAIVKITPVPASDTRLQAYRDVLKRRIHPPITRLTIESYSWDGGQIICIFVPSQPNENQPYLVSGTIVSGSFVRSGVTIVRRQGDASIPITAQELHSMLVAGRAFLRGKTYHPD